MTQQSQAGHPHLVLNNLKKVIKGGSLNYTSVS
jgi:hypothetical protein